MPERLARANRLRLSAERLRVLAEDSDGEVTRETTLEFARDFETLADELERAATKDGVPCLYG